LNNSKVIDLGDCPNCHSLLQPRFKNGYRSEIVDGVLFCNLCAQRGNLTEKVEWAKMIAEKEGLL